MLAQNLASLVILAYLGTPVQIRYTMRSVTCQCDPDLSRRKNVSTTHLRVVYVVQSHVCISRDVLHQCDPDLSRRKNVSTTHLRVVYVGQSHVCISRDRHMYMCICVHVDCGFMRDACMVDASKRLPSMCT